MSEDQFFKDEIKKAADFKFGAGVANVFDDMVNRSVPYYGEMQRMIAELAQTMLKRVDRYTILDVLQVLL